MSNLELYRNNDFEVDLTLSHKDLESGDITPLDLTGATIHFIVSKNKNTDAIIHKQITSFVDENNGVAKITLSNTDTDVQEGTYKYEIKIEDSMSKITTILIGDFVVKQIVKGL